MHRIVARSSSGGIAIPLYTSIFMSDVMFAHNRPHGRYGAWGYMYVVAASDVIASSCAVAASIGCVVS